MSEHQTASNKRFVIGAVLASLLLMALITAGVYLYAQQRPMLTADAALDAAFAADYERMQTNLDALKELDQPQLYYQTVLDCAKMADYNGNHDLALEVLHQFGSVNDEIPAAYEKQAEEQAVVYAYHQAMKLYEEGDYMRAARTAAQLRQYEPAQSLSELAQAAYQATLPTPTPTAVPSPTPEPTAAPSAEPTPYPYGALPTAAPTSTPETVSLLPEGRVAAGFAHTIALMEDGTVRAFGDNSFGQLEVGEWQNVVYVAAGAYHTLGLTADGRVLACGDNTHLQTEVAFYAGVKAIAAGDYASFLLLESGQVMSTGYLPYEFLNDLTGVQDMWAGSYGLLVKTADGVRASHPGLALDADCDLFAVSRGYAIGADANGTTHSTTALVPQWQGVKRLTASENAVIGLAEDGSVLAHAFGRSNRADFTFDQPVLAAAAAPNHYAFLLADGTLEIRHADGRMEKNELK